MEAAGRYPPVPGTAGFTSRKLHETHTNRIPTKCSIFFDNVTIALPYGFGSLPAHQANTSVTVPMVVSGRRKTACPTTAHGHRRQLSVPLRNSGRCERPGRPIPISTSARSSAERPFGLGGIMATSNRQPRIGVGHFVARYNIETFIVSPGTVAGVTDLHKPPFPRPLKA